MAKLNPETRQNIMEAARSVFLEKGYKEGRITEIADAANVSPATIYTYFLGKRELFQTLELSEADECRPEFERKRKKILDMARRLFGELGYHGTTIESIARYVGCSKAALYQYFSSKEELFAAVIHESDFRMAMSEQSAFSDEHEDLPQALKRIGAAYLQMFDSPQHLSLLRLLPELRDNPELSSIAYNKGFGYSTKLVADCLRRYRVADGADAVQAAKIFIGALYAHTIQNKLLPRPRDVSHSDEEVVALLTKIFVEGICPHGRPPASPAGDAANRVHPFTETGHRT